MSQRAKSGPSTVEAARHRQELALLRRLIDLSTTTRAPATMLQAVCRELAPAFETPRAIAVMRNAGKDTACLVADYQTDESPPPPADPLPAPFGAAWQYLFAQREPLVVDNSRNDSRLNPVRSWLGRQGLRRMLFLPLVVDGRGIGGVGLATARRGHFSAQEMGLGATIAAQISGALERARLNEALAQLQTRYRRLQQAAPANRLTEHVLNDFNNLLTAINGYAELLRLDLPPQTGVRDMAGNILDSGRRAANLVRQLSVLSYPHTPRTLHLNSVLAEMERMLSRIGGGKPGLKTDFAPGLWPVRADAGYIEQIVVNLVARARAVAPEGEALTVRTANVVLNNGYAPGTPSPEPGEYVLLALSDARQGGDQGRRLHLLDSRPEPGDAVGAENRGLEITSGMVAQNGGRLYGLGGEGGGVAFEIYFPRAKKAADSGQPD